MVEADLFENWHQQKVATNYHRLREPVEVEGEFNGRAGPSGYGYVRIRAEPSDVLSFTTALEWPTEFTNEYSLRIRDTVAETCLDVLLANLRTYPYRGCALTLLGLKWDPVQSSEASVRRASSQALETLRERGQWTLITGRYRVYD